MQQQSGKATAPTIFRNRPAFQAVILFFLILCSITGIAHGYDNATNGLPPVTRISAGTGHSCAVSSDSQAYCWGNGSLGQIDDPGVTITQVSVGSGHSCGLRVNGTLACWGDNSLGQATPPSGLFIQVSAGGNHGCGIRTNGTVTCWGDDSSAQATPPSGEFIQLSSGASHSCGIKADGTVACWGDNTGNKATPPGDLFIQVSAGAGHSCGVKDDGTVACWGDNTGNKATPPSGLFVQVSAGASHTCGITEDRTATCWGDNSSGQAIAPAGSTFMEVSAGGSHSCGTKTDGTIACWGDSSAGRTTPPPGTFRKPETADTDGYCALRGDGVIICETNSGAPYQPSGAPFISVYSFYTGFCALKSDGTQLCWGVSGDYDHLADRPPEKFRQLSVTSSGVCGVRTNGTLLCWGDNSYGQTNAPAGRFRQVSSGEGNGCGVRSDGSAVCWGGMGYADNTPPTGAFRQVVPSQDQNYGIRSDGTISCWGALVMNTQTTEYIGLAPQRLGPGNWGALRADGTADNVQLQPFDPDAGLGPAYSTVIYSTPSYRPVLDLNMGNDTALRQDGTAFLLHTGASNSVLARQLPLPAPRYPQISVGSGHSCLLSPAGTVSCWGDNSKGQATPPTGNFIQISAAGQRTCGLKNDGSTVCWGAYPALVSGPFRQIAAKAGGGDTTMAWDDTVSSRGAFLSLSANNLTTCGIKTDQTLSCWNSADSSTFAPTGIFTQVSVGGKQICAIKSDQSLTCWGDEFNGDAVAPSGTFNQVSVGGAHACSVRMDGTLVCWGDNSSGQATPPSGSFRQVSAGDTHNCAVRLDGGVICWGGNDAGQAPAARNPGAMTLTADSFVSLQGSPVTFTATVTAGSSPVTFFDGSSPLCTAIPINGSGQAQCSSSSLATGSHSITATTPATVAYLANSSVITHVITPAYSITYDGNNNSDGTVPVDGTHYANGATVTIAANSGNLTRTGYSFMGWNSSAAGSGTDYAASGAATLTMGSANVTLYAKWRLDLAVPVVSSIGANQATLSLTSGVTGSGWFTLHSGSGVACGTSAQVQAGQDSTGATAYRHGSLPLSANVSGSYTIRNLLQETPYTVCFAADNGTALQPGPLAAGFSTIAATSYATPGWSSVGASGFSAAVAVYESLAIAPDGAPWLAYNSGGVAKVMRYNGSAWEQMGGNASTTTVTYSTLAFAPDGTPYLAYSDNASSDKATVMKYSNGSWAAVGTPAFSAAGAYYLSLAIAPDNTPYLAYSDNAYSSGKATVMKYTNGTWAAVGSAGFSSGIAYYLSLAIAPDNTPWVAYKDYGNSGGATVMSYDSGSGWNAVGSVNLSGGLASSMSLAFAPDNTPYLAYIKSSTLYVKQYSNSAWSQIGSSIASASTPVLTFAPDGLPLLAYLDSASSSKATVKKYSGGVWGTLGNAGFSAGAVTYLTMAITPDGTPLVGYQDGGTSNYATVMRLRSSPVVTTLAASDITASGATLNGSVNPGGLSSTATFRYGVTPNSTSNSATATESPLTGQSLSNVTVQVTGLACGTSHSFKLSATNTGGTITGSVLTFTTSPCSVIYDGNGADSGSAPIDSNGYAPAATVTVKPVGSLAKTGYSFTGWNTAANGSGTSYQPDATFAMGSAAVTLYAQWGIASYSVTYNGNGNSSGSVPVDSASHAYGSSVTVLANSGSLTKTGATFYGWNSQADGHGTAYAASGSATLIMGGGNLTLYAQWSPLLATPTVTYSGAGELTISLQSSATGRGYVTLLTGSSALCGSGSQVKSGTDANNTAAYRYGSRALTADSATTYILRNLLHNSAYTVCFTADDGLALQGIPVTINAATTATPIYASPAWKAVGAAGFSAGGATDTVLAFGPDNAPYVAFQDAANGYGLTVMTYDGTGWAAVGSPNISAGRADYPVLAFSRDGSPYVAYADFDNNSFATVLKYANGAWSQVGESPSVCHLSPASLCANLPGEARDLSLAFDSANRPMVAFTNGNNRWPVTRTFDGSNWTNSSLASGMVINSPVKQTRLSIKPGNGEAFLSFRYYFGPAWDSRPDLLDNYTPNIWSPLGIVPVSTSGGQSDFPAMAFAPDNTLYYSYIDYDQEGKATVRKNLGTESWYAAGSGFFTPGSAEYPSLAVSPDGTPWLAYRDGANSGKVSVQQLAGADWAQVGSAGFSAGDAQYTSLAIAPDGTPHVAYRDNANGGKVTVMRLVSALTATTGAATAITATGATLNGTVNANEVATSVSFEYGLTASYGATVAATPSTVTGSSNTAVSANISGLVCNTSYHFRVSGINSNDTASGNDATFTTAPCSVTLNVSIFGNGSVTSQNGSGTNYTCNSGSCAPVAFNLGDTVTLTATGSNSSFSNWSGDYVSISNPGSITMNANKAITATFSPGAATVKIDNDSTPYYSINTALAAPVQNATIKATATGFTENVTMQNSHTLTLKGGYSDSNFSSQTGYSIINGTLTISSGTLVVDRVVVGP